MRQFTPFVTNVPQDAITGLAAALSRQKDPMGKLNDYTWLCVWQLAERRICSLPVTGLENKQPIFLLFTPRSGSKHFLSLLESIPDTRFDFEVLANAPRQVSKMCFSGPFRRLAKSAIAARVRQLQLGPHFLRPTFAAPLFSSKSVCLSYISQCLLALDSNICAVKFQYEHLQLGGISPSDLHEAFPNAKFVVLYRRSLAHQLVSDVMRHATGEAGWRANHKHRESRQMLRLSAAKIRSYFEAVRAINEEWLELPFLADHGTVVCYEDLCNNPQDAFERAIFPLLALAPVTVTNNRFQKQTNRSIEDIVENYEEVADLLQSPLSIQRFPAASAPILQLRRA